MVPTGITLHYSAGGSAVSSYRHLKANNLGYHFLIDRNGSVHQMYYLDSTCYHAGNATWKGESPNKKHIAICLASFGQLNKDNRTCYGNLICDAVERQNAHWEPATPEQEISLLQLCVWLCKNLAIKSEKICGHSEACVPVGRKQDVGGVISLSMAEFRILVHKCSVVR